MSRKYSFSGFWSAKLKKALEKQMPERYSMSCVGADIKAVTDAVNQGIDAHLEACFLKGKDHYTLTPDRFNGTRLNCDVSKSSMITLVRRLLESGEETA